MLAEKMGFKSKIMRLSSLQMLKIESKSLKAKSLFCFLWHAVLLIFPTRF